MDGEELRVAGEELRVDGEELRVDGEELRVDGEELRVDGEELRVDGEETLFPWNHQCLQCQYFHLPNQRYLDCQRAWHSGAWHSGAWLTLLLQGMFRMMSYSVMTSPVEAGWGGGTGVWPFCCWKHWVHTLSSIGPLKTPP